MLLISLDFGFYVQINRYRGTARINVSLVTDGKDPKPHAHELIGKNCQNGTCSVVIKGENMTVRQETLSSKITFIQGLIYLNF